MATAKAPATQTLLVIDEIREGVVILEDGGLRVVLMTAGVNFALRSEEEKQALIFGFQDFLNALDFPIEFVIQSRRVDGKEYLETISEYQERHASDLMRLQIKGYMDFIKDLLSSTNIMTKNFYIVVPLDPRTGREKRVVGPLETLRNYFGAKKEVRFDPQKFIIYKDQIMERARFVQINLRRIEINSVILGTEGLLELYWSLYNPSEGGTMELPPEIEGVEFEKY